MMKASYLAVYVALTLLLAAAPAATAQTVKLRLSVDPRGVARHDSPTGVAMKVGANLTAAQAKALGAHPAAVLSPVGGGASVPAQAVWSGGGGSGGDPEALVVLWVEPDIAAGKVKAYDLTLSPAGANPSGAVFAFKDGDGVRDLYLGDRPVWQHFIPKYDVTKHNEVYKHFHHVYGFHGEGFITKGAGGLYTHHRGIFMGWNKTSGPGGRYDFWHCTNGVSLRHRKYFTDREFTGPVAARAVSLAEWVDKADSPVVRETRTVTTWNVGPDRTLMDFDITLEAVGGDITLDGDPQHAGFQFRPVDSVKGTHAQYIRPATAASKGGDVWTGCQWVVNQFSVGDNPYVVMHMDHPQNPGTADGTTVYSTRAYGRFGSFSKLALKLDQPLNFTYRILVVDPKRYSDLSVEHFDALHADFVTLAKVTVAKGN